MTVFIEFISILAIASGLCVAAVVIGMLMWILLQLAML
jgi:hypothetical protein